MNSDRRIYYKLIACCNNSNISRKRSCSQQHCTANKLQCHECGMDVTRSKRIKLQCGGRVPVREYKAQAMYT